jgi:hypothetical protein
MREHSPQHAPIASATTASGYSASPAPWTRLALAPITDALEQPHPLDPETPRRLWRVWHWAVLIYPEPIPQHPTALDALRAEVPSALYNAVVRQLRWMYRVAVDPAPIRARIADWQRDHDGQRRAIAAAKRNSKARRAR